MWTSWCGRSRRRSTSCGTYLRLSRVHRSSFVLKKTNLSPSHHLHIHVSLWLSPAVSEPPSLLFVAVKSQQVPLSVPTGPNDSARDGWANFEGDTGYEREVRELQSRVKATICLGCGELYMVVTLVDNRQYRLVPAACCTEAWSFVIIAAAAQPVGSGRQISIQRLGALTTRTRRKCVSVALTFSVQSPLA